MLINELTNSKNPTQFFFRVVLEGDEMQKYIPYTLRIVILVCNQYKRRHELIHFVPINHHCSQETSKSFSQC